MNISHKDDQQKRMQDQIDKWHKNPVSKKELFSDVKRTLDSLRCDRLHLASFVPQEEPRWDTQEGAATNSDLLIKISHLDAAHAHLPKEIREAIGDFSRSTKLRNYSEMKDFFIKRFDAIDSAMQKMLPENNIPQPEHPLSQWRVRRNIVKGAACVVLLIGFADCAHWFYQLERWFVFFAFACLWWENAHSERSEGWKTFYGFLYGIFGILFNPIAPFHFERENWNQLDFITLFVLFLPYAKNGTLWIKGHFTWMGFFWVCVLQLPLIWLLTHISGKGRWLFDISFAIFLPVWFIGRGIMYFLDREQEKRIQSYPPSIQLSIRLTPESERNSFMDRLDSQTNQPIP